MAQGRFNVGFSERLRSGKNFQLFQELSVYIPFDGNPDLLARSSVSVNTTSLFMLMFYFLLAKIILFSDVPFFFIFFIMEVMRGATLILVVFSQQLSKLLSR